MNVGNNVTVDICPSTDKGPVLNVVKFVLAEIPVLNQNDGTPFPHQNIVSPFPALLYFHFVNPIYVLEHHV